jgi:GTPase SAR1 family protein
LPSQYYRGIQGILLVYDITNSDSFARIEEWFRKIDENCKVEQLILTLVGNKVDLEERRQIYQEDAA